MKMRTVSFARKKFAANTNTLARGADCTRASTCTFTHAQRVLSSHTDSQAQALRSCAGNTPVHERNPQARFQTSPAQKKVLAPKRITGDLLRVKEPS